ncbi:S-adenosyl-L-methionine-dependent methyltransferase [Athelia psychrophila]|uniref:S-adenosyl-L-methionine-dependent methyltransferase n=1 Tax=Athelia psychrophila TaxID=1759441 RepID=A0A166N582_9AGAM|nr:S-adenosyl-L-methionine-dependent methyltransferase [Fibularhizoctonia sp. CBS 109695]
MSTKTPSDQDPGPRLQQIIGQDPTNGWDTAWQQNLTPWDRGNVQPPLRDLLVSDQVDWPRNGRALVPGCGRGYDPIFIAATLGLDTLAIDISPTAIKAANDLLAQTPLTDSKGTVAFRDADFFTLAPPQSELFDLIYDYTFFVAIPPARRVEWGQQMNKLVKKGGYLITLVFPLGIPKECETGPPFRVEPVDYLEPLGPGWEKMVDKIPEVSFEANVGRERMVVWKKL